MTHAKRFTLVLSVVALTSSPALLADDGKSDASLLQTVIDAIVSVLLPDADAAAGSGDQTEAGPNIIFIG